MKTTWLIAALAAAVLLVAGCGGDDSPAESGAASGSSASSDDPAARFAQCMRENGVPDFPDPQNGRLTLRGGPGSGLDPNSPEFQQAQQACRDLMPQGGQVAGQDDELQARMLEYAKCMRENGVPDFPDPQFSGGAVRMQLPPGVSEDSPQFQRAQQACRELQAGPGGSP
jgi:hypothetical protein